MSSAFEWTCERLEAQTDLSRIEARGTVRIALKGAGFDPKRVDSAEMAVVLRKVMPEELRSRRVEGAEGLCEALAREVASFAKDDTTDTPEQIFARLGR